MNEEIKRVFDAFDTLGTTEAYVFSYKVRGRRMYQVNRRNGDLRQKPLTIGKVTIPCGRGLTAAQILKCIYNE